MSLDIKFISPIKEIPSPSPSKLFIPDGFKKMERSTGGNPTQGTVKRCVPFLDALTTGYIIPFASDIHYIYNEDEKAAEFTLPKNVTSIDKHYISVGLHANSQVDQELRHNKRTVEAVFKFTNPWKIITPPGYSCIFTQPFNRNFPFKIIDGIVDTDIYPNHVHFPFYWTNDSLKQFTIKRASPMVLVIPFKRNSWQMSVEHIGLSEHTKRETKSARKFFYEFLDNYKRKFWFKKEYK